MLAQEPITVILWLWGTNSGPGHRWDSFFKFDADMLVRMADAIRRNLHIPHRIVAATDLPKSALPEWVEHLDIKEHFGDLRQLGGCWLRLKAFAPELRPLLGGRVAWIDLDAVVTGDLTPILNRPEDIVLYRSDSVAGQTWNGSMVLFSPEKCHHVWNNYDPKAAHKLTRDQGFRGTDQSWLAYCYGPDTPHWTWQDGVYYYNLGVGRNLPPNAKLVLFPGRNKPNDPVVRYRSPWLRDLWPMAGERVSVPSWNIDGAPVSAPAKRKRTMHDIRREHRLAAKAAKGAV